MDNETLRLQNIYLRLKKLVSAKRRAAGKDNFKKFVEMYFKNLATHSIPAFHEEIMSLLNQLESGDEKKLYRLLLIAPRGFAKSTICSIFFPLWLCLYGKKKDIFLVSATIGLCKEMLRKIRVELETNEKILEDFGDLKSDKWTEDMLVLRDEVKDGIVKRKGSILRAKGRGFQIRGFRPDIIVCDDLEDEEVIYSKEQRDKLEQWFFRTLLPALKPDQTLLYVGTMIHQASLMAKLREKEEFAVRFYKALTNDKSIWEELWPTEKLKKLRNELGSYAFEAEYQNNPISLEDQPIKPHMLDCKVYGKPDITCMAIDPAISEKTGADYRAITVYGRIVDKDGEITGFKEIFSDKGKWGLEEQVDKMLDIYERYMPTRVVIEEVAFQKVFRKVLVDKGRKRKLFLPVSEAVLGTSRPGQPVDKRPKDKFTRLMSVVHLFEQKLVEVINPELKQELIAFPHGDYDDYVDATVYALYWLMNFRSGSTMIKREKVGLPGSLGVRQAAFLKEVKPGVWQQVSEPDPVKVKSNFINYDRR